MTSLSSIIARALRANAFLARGARRAPSIHSSLPMMVLALAGTLWGSSSVPAVGASFTPAFISPAASNSFVARLSLPAPGATSTFTDSAERRFRCQQPASRKQTRQRGHGTSMLFDFIKKRAQEGVEQTQNLVSAAQEGRLEEALKETSEYVKDRQGGGGLGWHSE